MTTPITTDFLDRLDALHAAATPGEWTAHYESADRGDVMVRATDDDPAYEPEYEDILFGPRRSENWELLLESRTALPLLVENMRRLMAENKRLRTACRAFLARYDNHMVNASLLFSDVADAARAALDPTQRESEERTMATKRAKAPKPPKLKSFIVRYSAVVKREAVVMAEDAEDAEDRFWDGEGEHDSTDLDFATEDVTSVRENV